MNGDTTADGPTAYLRLLRPMGDPQAAREAINRIPRASLFNLAPIADVHQDVQEIYDLRFPKKPLTIEETAKLRRAAINEALKDEQRTLDDLKPYRIKAIWRIVRELARIGGLVRDNSSILDGDLINPEKWTEPLTVNKPALSHRAYSRITAERLLACPFQPSIGLLPPDPPPGTDLETYDPDEDEKLAFYLQTLMAAAKHLGILNGCPSNPAEGAYALAGIDDMYLIRAVFPTPIQIATYEGMIVEQTSRHLVHYGIDYVFDRLTEVHGFNITEINQLISIAREQVRAKVFIDPETDKAMMVLRLEGYMKRAKRSMNLGAEIQGLKQMALTLGLYRDGGENPMKDVIESIRTISQERTEREMAQTKQQMLTKETDNDPEND